MANTVWGHYGHGMPDAHVNQAGFDPQNPEIKRAVALASELIGFPRHLSQHVGGYILTKRRLDETVPIGNAAMPDRTFIEWDKDDIDVLGLMKVDILALGMLSAIRKGLEMLRQHHGLDYTDIAHIPQECPGVYEMLGHADSVGVFQVESRAQMSMLPRLRPKRFYDLVIEVAIVRPGPIQGDMVHPYLRRREGKEPVTFPAPSPEHGPPDELRDVLGKTLGVPLFQEQAMRLAIEAARFSPEEANGLRRSMATFKNQGDVGVYGEKFVQGMVRRGYDPDFAQRCFKQIEGFGSYGFPESHAVSFALLVYASAWIKRWYPDVFCAALINSQPMGFYQPAQLVRDARDHGVEVRPPDVLLSDWDCTLEGEGGGWKAVRLGLRQVRGLKEKEIEQLMEAREAGARTLPELIRRGRLTRRSVELLAEADAFRSVGLDRRAALWAAKGLKDEGKVERDAPLLAGLELQEAKVELPRMALPQHVAEDYRTISLSLKAHPCAFFRDELKRMGAMPAEGLKTARNGGRATVAGLVLIRQRPGTAKGVTFLTLEDESGPANIVCWQDRFEANRRVLMTSSFLLVRGRVQREGEVIHLVAESFVDLTGKLAELRHEPGRGAEAMVRSRDFH
jgi:error-prone DNA polymerase